jgi:lipopolysaccharide export system protein LptA
MITVDCEGPLEVDYAQGYAVFNDNVVVESSEGKMFSEKATVFFLKDTKTIERIVSEGDVKIIRDDNVTFAEKATYIEAEKRLILEGRPRLILFPEDEDTRN